MQPSTSSIYMIVIHRLVEYSASPTPTCHRSQLPEILGHPEMPILLLYCPTPSALGAAYSLVKLGEQISLQFQLSHFLNVLTYPLPLSITSRTDARLVLCLWPAYTVDTTETGANEGLEPSSESGGHFPCATPIYVATQKEHQCGTFST